MHWNAKTSMGFGFGGLLFSQLLFSLPEANAQDVSKGKDFFIAQCIFCHAFTCNKDGPRLGGLFGRKSASVEDYR